MLSELANGQIVTLPLLVLGLFLLMGVALCIVRPLFGFAFLVIGDIVLPIISHDLMIYGVISGAIIGVIAAGCLLRSVFRPQRLPRSMIYVVLWCLLAMTLTHCLIGFARGNPLSLILGDLYHLCIEIIVVYFVSSSCFHTTYELRRFYFSLVLIVTVSSAAVTVLYFTGLMSSLHLAGYVHPSGLYRLNLQHGFPTLYLPIMFAFLLKSEGWKTHFTGFGILCSLIILVLTLKRTYWLATAFSLVSIILAYAIMERSSRQGIAALRKLSLPIGALPVVAILWLYLFPGAVSFLQFLEIAEVRALSMAAEGTLDIRTQQFEDIIEYIARNPLGYGLGSEFYLIGANPEEEVFVGYAMRHYVHNVFLHYSAQIGLAGSILYYAFIFLILRQAWLLCINKERFGLDDVSSGFVLASIGVVTSIVVAGATTVASNTFVLSLFGGIICAVKMMHVRSVVVSSTPQPSNMFAYSSVQTSH